MILSDGEIRAARDTHARGLIDPWNDDQLQSSSYDVTLDHEFKVVSSLVGTLDPRSVSPRSYRTVSVADAEWFLIKPGSFVLGSTIEAFSFPDDMVGQLSGKSSLGRLGLQIHSTAGFFDAGFRGQATLEISNIGSASIKLYPGMRIAQMAFIRMGKPAERPYGHPDLGSHYQDQVGVTEAKS